MAGIYIHIPFCESKCAYCDFYSVAGRQTRIPDFIQALCREIMLRARSFRNQRIETIYFGGGTPSLLHPDGLKTILRTIEANYKIVDDIEITIELNPASMDANTLRRYGDLGINRLSIGIQSFDADELKLLGRPHSAKEARQVIREARVSSFDNVGIDLIFGIPGQTVDTWKQTLTQAVEFNPAHVSCYALSWNVSTPLGRRILEGRIPEPDDDTVADLYLLAHDILTDAVYEHYEISNYAKPGRRCRHNESYWTGMAYLGFGPSAHSYIDGERSWNVPDVRQYIDVLSQHRHRLPIAGCEALTEDQKAVERLALALRRSEGLPLSEADGVTDKIAELTPRYGRMIDGRFKPNAEGFLVADEIAAELAA